MRSHPYYTCVLKHSRAKEIRSARQRTLKLINILHADGAEKESFLSMWRMACAYFNAQCGAAMESSRSPKYQGLVDKPIKDFLQTMLYIEMLMTFE